MSLSHYIACRIIKKHKRIYDPNNPPDYIAKQNDEKNAPTKKIPKSINLNTINLGGSAAELLTCPENPKNKIIMYIHGGGFVGGSAKTRRDITVFTAGKLGYNVASINYRLAPQHIFPAAPQDCFSAYRALEQQYGGENIALMGESAGGNLVLSVVLQAKAAGIKLPACVVAISPLVQHDKKLPSYSENIDSDCMISNISEELTDVYFKTDAPDVLQNPYAAPLYGDLSNFPPTWLIASETEVLRDDSVVFHKKLKKAGRESHLRLYPGLMHAFAIVTTFPEARKALYEMKPFIDRHLCLNQ